MASVSVSFLLRRINYIFFVVMYSTKALGRMRVQKLNMCLQKIPISLSYKTTLQLFTIQSHFVQFFKAHMTPMTEVFRDDI